jgi:hypothetical protein
MLGGWLAHSVLAAAEVAPAGFRRLPVREYRDKMKGRWIGQIVGVSWGAPTEFRWKDQIIPEADMPKWAPKMINDAFGQDDLDLSTWAGRRVKLELVNQATGWAYEAAYWAELSVRSK